MALGGKSWDAQPAQTMTQAQLCSAWDMLPPFPMGWAGQEPWCLSRRYGPRERAGYEDEEEGRGRREEQQR